MQGSNRATPIKPLPVTSDADDIQQGSANRRQDLAAPGKTVPQSTAPETNSKSGEAIRSAVSTIADYVQHITRDLDFSVDEISGRQVVKVFDSQTGKLIRQIPPEEVLTISRQIATRTKDPIRGLVLRNKA